MTAVRSETIFHGSHIKTRERSTRLEVIEGGRRHRRSAWHPSMGGRPRRLQVGTSRDDETATERPNFFLRRLAVGSLAAALLLAGIWIHATLQSPNPVPSGETHVVQKGESLWIIAVSRKPGADPRAEVEKLRRLNNVNSDIRPGQVLQIPG